MLTRRQYEARKKELDERIREMASRMEATRDPPHRLEVEEERAERQDAHYLAQRDHDRAQQELRVLDYEWRQAEQGREPQVPRDSTNRWWEKDLLGRHERPREEAAEREREERERRRPRDAGDRD